MSQFSAQQLASLLVIVLVIVAGRHLRRLGGLGNLARLRAELQRLPVYSAETIRHTEAEFIRDKRPKRFPTVLVVALYVLFAAAAWWLTR
ncbi:MAG TPA: hypothetical protein VMV37_08845 [Gammaproteobacteria bacterium]|nr:hypothetical protein [Gammaproteobacteria bacterium]